MRQGFRQTMAWLHTCSSLVPGWILYFMFLTGTVGYFSSEIDRWMRPELPLRTEIDPAQAVVQGLQQLRQRAPEAVRWSIDLPDRDRAYVRLSWLSSIESDDSTVFRTDMELAESGAERIKSRETGGGHALYQMHWGLNYLPQQTAYWIVGLCGMALLIALISGVIAHRRMFKDFFTFRPRKGARSWLDAHAVLGVMALPYYSMIAYTGLVLLMSVYWPRLMHEIEDFDKRSTYLFNRAFNQLDARDPENFFMQRAGISAPLFDIGALVNEMEWRDGRLLSISVLNPGDINARVIITRMPRMPLSRREELVFNGTNGELLYGGAAPSRASEVNQVLTGLHEAAYAGTLLRWLYFISGLMGAAMIATGLILWTVKRRRKHAEAQPSWGLALVERLNVGVIAGLPIGIAAYFWANRLLPVDFAQRAEWELHTLFVVWLLLVLYATSRPLMRSWFELLSIAALAFGLLPLLNALTTDRHLGVTLAHDHWRGDWALASFDLTALTLGLAFAGMAWRVWRCMEAHQLHPGVAANFPSLHAEVVK